MLCIHRPWKTVHLYVRHLTSEISFAPFCCVENLWGSVYVYCKPFLCLIKMIVFIYFLSTESRGFQAWSCDVRGDEKLVRSTGCSASMSDWRAVGLKWLQGHRRSTKCMVKKTILTIHRSYHIFSKLNSGCVFGGFNSKSLFVQLTVTEIWKWVLKKLYLENKVWFSALSWQYIL